MSDSPADYKPTLNLPKTDFAMKADLPNREPQMLKSWESVGLYQQIQAARQGAPKFILHDGPPYANGDIHIGHALNKILKDFIVRYKTMRGFASPYVPGWDCHGMPIEHQLFKELKITKRQIDQVAFREKAKVYAQRFVGVQREQFKRLGVSGDWERPYLTMAPEYERVIVRSFMDLVKAGYVYRGKKPVYWCFTDETALAEAEVEYEDRTDTSIFVKFPVTAESAGKLWNDLGTRSVFIVIWTTTPWTLPANVAAAVHPERGYRRVDLDGECWIVADELHAKLLQTVGKSAASSPVVRGQQLTALQYERPFSKAPGRVVTDEYVSMEEGTGIVHIAPGHGHEDYLIGTRFGLEVLSPVNEQGRFTKDVPAWEGVSVYDANPNIVEDLKRRGLLVREQPVTHSYPHCWRCKQPVIFRATPQWFLRVDEALRQKLLASISSVTWTPEAGQSRMRGMLENRPDWCLSRQRYWGTPIPVLRCAQCDEPLLQPTVLDQIQQRLTERGTDLWFTAKPEELAPGARCPTCGGASLRKESDILDVWFDSGVSSEAVLKQRPELRWPADLYLEGSDQHRGWFQVSLIPAVALHVRPPFEGVLTHGFVMDGEGRKMSKSLGNVVAPQQVMQRYGADVLRLWVASVDYSEDVRISDAILDRVADGYRKIRNTIRYLLSNLYDFDPSKDRQPQSAWPEMDRWAVMKSRRLLANVTAAYDAYAFHQIYRDIYQFCVVDLSSFYLDALKDRLYTDGRNSPKRRCAQSALHVILNNLVRVLAPILPMTADEAWQAMRSLKGAQEPSVHLALWPDAQGDVGDRELDARWQTLLTVRGVVMKALETQRAANVIGSPLEARVTLAADGSQLRQLLEQERVTLQEMCVVSEVAVTQDGEAQETGVSGLARVDVDRAPGQKCARCWKYRQEVGRLAEHPQLCARCVDAIGQAQPGAIPTKA